MKKYALAFLLLMLPVTAHAATVQTGSDTTTLNSPTMDDTFLTGHDVIVDKSVGGELVVFGQNITVSSTPGRSMLLVGTTISVEKGSSYNTVIAGGTVTLDGVYNNDIYVAGNHVTVKSTAQIHGSLFISSGDTNLAGTVDGNVTIDGLSATTEAKIHGDLSGTITNLTFTGGSVGGNVNYTSNQDAVGLAQAGVIGNVTRHEVKALTFVDILVAFLSMLLFTAFVVLVTPRHSREMYDKVKENWGRNWLMGLGVVLVVPLLGFLFVATFIGWKVAMVIFALYMLVLLLAGAYSTIVFGELLLKLSRVQIATPSTLVRTLLVGGLGTLVIALLSLIPYLGFIIVCLIWLVIALAVVGSFTETIIREQR